MNDLLGAARAGQTNSLYAGEGGDLEEGGYHPPPTDSEKEMQEFFKQVEAVKTDMAEIRGLQREVNQMNEKSKIIVKSKEMQKHREDMQVGKGERVGSSEHTVRDSGTPDPGAPTHLGKRAEANRADDFLLSSKTHTNFVTHHCV